MDVITNPALDFKTLTAIVTANPEGMAIIGAWNGMETLAREDPEGCVRLCPGLPMDNRLLAAFFRCSVAIVEKTVEVFVKLGRFTVTDGLIRVTGCGEVKPAAPEPVVTVNPEMAPGTAPKPVTKQDASEDALAIKREKDRIRKAKSRARQKEAQMTETEDNVTPVTPCDRCDRCDGGRDICDNRCDTGDTMPVTRRTGIPAGRDGYDTTCDINNNNNNIYPLYPLQAHKPVSKYADLHNLVPLHELPEEYRNVIAEWNKLPLPKFRGLVPELLDKLKFLMRRYGEKLLCKTIAGIAGNAFLLGKKEGRTWTVSLGWLLEPANFAKVLSGKYKDQNRGDSRCLNLRPGGRLPFYLPGEGEEGFTPEEQEQALRDLFIPTTPAQLKAARLVGLPGYKEATA